MPRRKGAGYLSPAEYCHSGGSATNQSSCMRLNCFKQGPHSHGPIRDEYNGFTNNGGIENYTGINERAVQKQQVKETFRKARNAWREKNRQTARNSLRNNRKIHTRRSPPSSNSNRSRRNA